jgi:hypothetical protein
MPNMTLPPARAHGTTHGPRCEHMPKTTLPPARAHGTTHGSRCEDMPKTTLPPARAHAPRDHSRVTLWETPQPPLTHTRHHTNIACDAGHALDPPCMQVLTTTPTRCWTCPREVALGKHPEAAASVELLPPPSEAAAASVELLPLPVKLLLLQWSCSPLPVKLLLLQWSCSPLPVKLLLLQWSCSPLPVKRAVLAQSRALRCCFERCSREAHEGRLVGDVGAGHHRSDSRAAVWAA